MDELGTETALEVLARAKALEKQGKEIIHLEIGEPDFDTPQHIKEAAVRALKAGYTHYTPANGILELREAIAHEIAGNRNIDVHPDEVVVTPGAKPIIFFSILAHVNPSEEVLYPNPGFPIYESVINFAGAKPIPIPLEEEREFRFDPDFIRKKITRKTKMIILNSPGNPTGGILTKNDLKVVADLIADRDNILVLSDEVYNRIIYEGTHESLASLPGMKEKTVILDGFSKTYAMTGWRIGYGIMQRNLAQKITQLMINSNSCTCAFTQMAGIEALKGSQSETEKMVAEFKRRREVIVSGLNKIKGFSCLKPHGAFYAFPSIKNTGKTASELADLLLNESGVATLSGTSFGKFGEGHLRISFANSVENIEKALTKVTEWIGR
jgi:aspartate/methionine/tyrosine aminotransferase